MTTKSFASDKFASHHATNQFFRGWLRNPAQMGSVVPSSPVLGQLIAKHIEKGWDPAALKLGAGTGAVTHSLIRSGITPKRIVLVEIGAVLCSKAFIVGQRDLPRSVCLRCNLEQMRRA
jgi:phospholipid N-methyltransferase